MDNKLPSIEIAFKEKEAILALSHGPGLKSLSFKAGANYAAWRIGVRRKLAELLGVTKRISQPAFRVLRSEDLGDVTINVVQMQIGNEVAIPAYYLVPDKVKGASPVMAIHGHGEAEACIGISNDYHNGFALFLARQGYVVLCPELRGFGVLKDMARDIEGARLDYWNWGNHMAYSLVSEANLHGRPLMGQTVLDLLAWEAWLCDQQKVRMLHVAGISYGGDLALMYPVFSDRKRSIFASGTMGSFSVIFSGCYNAPAHTIPAVLQYMDRSDIAGMNAPTPIAIHYGELDVPGPENYSASYNETVPSSLEELKLIYSAAQATHAPQLIVSKGIGHEMDNIELLNFIALHE